MKFAEGTREQAKKENPGAAKIVKVTGGYAVFDTIADYETWRNQK
jgi:hypothetical protein